MLRLAYVDTSALAKLLLPEPESQALEQTILDCSGLVSSWLTAAELRRAAGRTGKPSAVAHVDETLNAVVLIEMTPALLEAAGEVQPAELRTLDAIHLATALSMGEPGLEFITYDDRLAMAARAAGLRVLSPGR